MTRPSAGTSGLLLLAATTLWGASSAVLAALGDTRGTGAPLLAAGGALALLVVVLAGPGRRQLGSLARTPGRSAGFLVIGLLEALNLGLYAAALSLGPVPVVVALHLTSPLLLLGVAVLRGRRRIDGLVVAQTLLMVTGIVLLGLQPDDRVGDRPLLAGVLAVGSAVAVAALITTVARYAPSVRPDVASTVQLGLAAAVTAPVVLVAAAPGPADSLALLAAGAAFLGPGFALYWRALRRASPATAGIIGLNEAVAATLFSIVVFGDRVSLAAVLSGALVLVAVVLETVRPEPVASPAVAGLPDEAG